MLSSAGRKDIVVLSVLDAFVEDLGMFVSNASVVGQIVVEDCNVDVLSPRGLTFVCVNLQCFFDWGRRSLEHFKRLPVLGPGKLCGNSENISFFFDHLGCKDIFWWGMIVCSKWVYLILMSDLKMALTLASQLVVGPADKHLENTSMAKTMFL